MEPSLKSPPSFRISSHLPYPPVVPRCDIIPPPIILTPKLAGDLDTFHGRKSIRPNIWDIDSGSRTLVRPSYPGAYVWRGVGGGGGGRRGSEKGGGKGCTCSITGLLSGPPRRLNNGVFASARGPARLIAIPLAFADTSRRGARNRLVRARARID